MGLRRLIEGRTSVTEARSRSLSLGAWWTQERPAPGGRTRRRCGAPDSHRRRLTRGPVLPKSLERYELSARQPLMFPNLRGALERPEETESALSMGSGREIGSSRRRNGNAGLFGTEAGISPDETARGLRAALDDRGVVARDRALAGLRIHSSYAQLGARVAIPRGCSACNRRKIESALRDGIRITSSRGGLRNQRFDAQPP